MGREGRLSVRVAGLGLLPTAARRPRLFQRAVRRAFAAGHGPRSGEVSVVFLGRAAMRRLNRRYLGHDHDTDVIAFPHEPVPRTPTRERPLGDIYVCSALARAQARARGLSLLREALTLVAHGALHLVGHDDSRPGPKARMFALQDRIAASLDAQT